MFRWKFDILFSNRIFHINGIYKIPLLDQEATLPAGTVAQSFSGLATGSKKIACGSSSHLPCFGFRPAIIGSCLYSRSRYAIASKYPHTGIFPEKNPFLYTGCTTHKPTSVASGFFWLTRNQRIFRLFHGIKWVAVVPTSYAQLRPGAGLLPVTGPRVF